jgi:hypothetical protein
MEMQQNEQTPLFRKFSTDVTGYKNETTSLLTFGTIETQPSKKVPGQCYWVVTIHVDDLDRAFTKYGPLLPSHKAAFDDAERQLRHIVETLFHNVKRTKNGEKVR